MGSLGGRLGVLLFQLPPNLKRDLPRLSGFLDMLPEGTPAAFEFRHESWMDDGVHALLRSRGMALVCADTDDAEGDEPLVGTAPWGYVRLRRPDYTDADLARWVERIGALGWQHAFVFFKHEDEGAGPRMAARFREIAEPGGEG